MNLGVSAVCKNKIFQEVSRINQITTGGETAEQTWEEYGITNWINEHDSILYLIFDCRLEEVLAYAIMKPNGRLDALARSKKDKRTKGMGRVLLQHIVNRMNRERPKFRIVFWQSRYNQELIGFYDSFGIDQKKHFYQRSLFPNDRREYRDTGFVRYQLSYNK